MTGGGSGIGKSIASAFTTAGARAVILLGRTKQTLESAAQELSEQAGTGALIRYFTADVRDTEAIAQVFKTVRAEVGPIDVLVSNAGYLSKPGCDREFGYRRLLDGLRNQRQRHPERRPGFPSFRS